jgi:hypothetical protein
VAVVAAVDGTWVCAAAIMADEQVCQGTNIQQAAQDEHIQGSPLKQRPAVATAAAATGQMLQHC